MKCTCNSGKSLHLAHCDIVLARNKDALGLVHSEAMKEDGSIFYYVTRNDDMSGERYDKFKRQCNKDEYMFIIEAGAVHSITLMNGSEVTFLSEPHAFQLPQFGISKRIFIETFPGSRDVGDLLTPFTGAITFVDEEAHQLI